LRSFAPVLAANARALILGSMPGGASLAASQYYAHPQNQFWRIMGTLYGAGPDLAYEQRLQTLQSAGISLWDVLHSCVRRGSLDAAIERASALPNDLPALLQTQPGIACICCNGLAAYQTLQRHFAPRLASDFPHIDVLRLPSTSPAHASWSYDRKRAAWAAALSRV
jgi:hypoxanthine-DNA glycosylase